MISPIAFSVGPFTLYWYSLFILLGIVCAYFIARPAARKLGISADHLQASILFGVLPGIVGARLYHVIDQWSLYSGNLPDILAINQGGLGILGGIAGGVLGLWWYARRINVPLLSLLDVWAPGMLFAQGLGRFGNYTNQEAFGPPTDLPWAIFIDPANRPAEFAEATQFHPTFFYEAAWDFGAVALLLLLRPKLLRQPGRLLGAYFILYGIGRIIAESFRFDTAEIAGVPVAYVIVAGLMGLGAWLLLRRRAPDLPGSA